MIGRVRAGAHGLLGIGRPFLSTVPRPHCPQARTVACSRNASKALFAFSAASIFRLVRFVIFRSVFATTERPLVQLVNRSQNRGPLHASSRDPVILSIVGYSRKRST